MEFDKIKTEALIYRMQNGEAEAYNEFYEEWYQRSFYIALAITHNEADAKDAAQDTMIQIHNSIKDLRDPGYFKLWLNRIIISKCTRLFRKRKAPVMSESQMDMMFNKVEDRQYLLPMSIAHRDSDQITLHQIMQKLHPIYREVLALMYFEQLSIKEIAECLQIPDGTVKSRLNSARTKLRKEIEAYEKANDITLDFHGLTLEAALVAVYASITNAKNIIPTAIKLTTTSSIPGQSLKSATWLSNIAIGVLGTVVALSGALALRDIYAKPETTTLPQPQIEVTKFEEMQFKDITIHDAKDAYYVLMKYGHCDDELAQLNNEEQEKISFLKEELEKNSEIYTKLYENFK